MSDPEAAELVRSFSLALAMGDYAAAETHLRKLAAVEPERTKEVIRQASAMLDMDDAERLAAFPWLRSGLN